MNQIDSYKINGRRGYFEPVKIIGNSENFEHFKSVMSSSSNNLNKKTTSWSSAAHESNSIEQSSPLFVKSISQNFKIKNKFNIKFLKDSDQISSQQSRVTVYDSIINNSSSNNNNNNNKIPNSNVSIKSSDFFTSANDSFFSNPSSRKYKSKSASNYHFMQSQPSSASNGNLKLKITNLTIKHATIDMSDQLAMIPDSSNDNHNSYIFGDKAKLLAKLIEKSSNLEEKSLCCIACSKKKSIDLATLTNNNNKLSIQNLYLNVDLEKGLRLNDDLNESSLNNTSYSNWNTSSLFMKSHSKYNTKLDRQFKKIVPNPNTAPAPLVSKSRIKSSKNESVYANHFQAMKSNTDISSSRNSQHSILGSVNGTSIKLKFPNLNKDLLSENISLNSEFNNKTGFETNQYATTSLYEFSTGKT
jgi:hypothetical protein